ncbi:hypothetical protein AJ80_04157 [Polytolypa hystricis UAMH7299]|uniref:Peptidase S8/S53 domain-containing protein n=1 Tax=Polytolypa hystricis (strain UAMH7299) TaxID=1447883 RepID=A0A2B7YCC4_POLH7|nr:hypothetical protein AJ80_04157 [Polytolypa hystricis UAMH7299]
MFQRIHSHPSGGGGLLAVLLLVPFFTRHVSAADCYGTSPGAPRGSFLGPVNLQQGMCDQNRNTIFGCHGQPSDDCMTIVTDTEDNKNLLFRRQRLGEGEPQWSNCDGAFGNIMEQCIDSGSASTGIWTLGQERYMAIWTENVRDLKCMGNEGKLSSQVESNGAIDATFFNSVAQAVCSCRDGVRCAREANAGDNWLIRGSRSSPEDSDDYSLCFQAMTRIMNGCILNKNHVGGEVVSGRRNYELRAIRASTRLIQAKDISDADFDELVNKARDMTQATDAKRSPLDRREPAYNIPETSYRAFQLTADPGIFNQLHQPQLAIGRHPKNVPSPAAKGEQQNSPGHLKDLSSQGNRESNYKYDSCAGEGSIVYVLDTGIFADHPEFKDNTPLIETLGDDVDPSDKNGYGTGVASLVNGATVGVAKKAKVMSIKIYEDNGRNQYPDAKVIEGLHTALAHVRGNGYIGRAVVNLSYGGRTHVSSVLKTIEQLNNAGILVVASAGNFGEDSCNNFPGGALAEREIGLCVGAVDGRTSRRHVSSNSGKCVNVWAPGNDVTTAVNSQPGTGWWVWLWGDNGYKQDSGTSLAAPIVGGMIAYEISRTEFKFRDAHVRDFVDYFSRTGREIFFSGNTADRLINNKAGQDTCEDRFGRGRCPR